MRDSVRAAFTAFSERFEGKVPWLYQDNKGLVSTGIGNLADPLALALPMPFVMPDGTRATAAEITAEWQVVKAFPNAARLGHLVLQHVTKLRLTEDGIAQIVGWRLDANEAILVKRFPGFADWPADAQLATHSMAWACGAEFHFPELAQSLLHGDFIGAAQECHIQDADNPGVRPRNVANRTLYLNAAYVQGSNLDAADLYWPRSLMDDEPTKPSLAAPPMPPADVVHPDVDVDFDVGEDDET